MSWPSSSQSTKLQLGLPFEPEVRYTRSVVGTSNLVGCVFWVELGGRHSCSLGCLLMDLLRSVTYQTTHSVKTSKNKQKRAFSPTSQARGGLTARSSLQAEALTGPQLRPKPIRTAQKRRSLLRRGLGAGCGAAEAARKIREPFRGLPPSMAVDGIPERPGSAANKDHVSQYFWRIATIFCSRLG